MLREKEDPGELEATRRRHAEFYADFTRDAPPGLDGDEQGAWIAALDAERAMRAALTFAIERGDELGVMGACEVTEAAAATHSRWQRSGSETGRDRPR
jgi:hypothetical protein